MSRKTIEFGKDCEDSNVQEKPGESKCTCLELGKDWEDNNIQEKPGGSKCTSGILKRLE